MDAQNENSPMDDVSETASGAETTSKAWEKPVVMRLAVSKAEGANNYDDDMDFKGAS